MCTAISGLSWEIWARNRRLVWLIVGIVLFGVLFNAVLPDAFRATKPLRQQLLTIDCLLMIASLVLVFAAFNYTELNLQRDWTGYPYRLFSLPVSTWWLAAVPIGLGIASVELVYWTWLKLVFVRQEIPLAGWLAVVLGAYVVFYETTLWCLARFRILRLVVLGFGGTSFIGVAMLPCFYAYVPSPWLSEGRLSATAVTLSFAAFAVALKSLSWERTGGGQRRRIAREWIERVSDVLPQRRTAFPSASAAHFWFEWRRSGWLLPAFVATALLLVIGPISWNLRQDSGAAVWILGWTLAMPVILALPIGKGFSKAEVWSTDVSVRAFDAVRPLATGEMVVIKLKVAALSATISWGLIVVFLAAWLPGWADLRVLDSARVGFWMVYHHTTAPQYSIMVLAIVAGLLLTWRGLVCGLWLGLWGRPKWFVAVPAVYAVTILAANIGMLMLAQENETQPEGWLRDPNRVLQCFQWLAAVAVIGKVWLAVWSWRRITPRRILRYLLIWGAAVGCLVGLVLLVWAHGALVLLCGPLDPIRFRNTLLLAAIFVLPLARVGIAPCMLAKNRHGENAGEQRAS